MKIEAVSPPVSDIASLGMVQTPDFASLLLAMMSNLPHVEQRSSDMSHGAALPKSSVSASDEARDSRPKVRRTERKASRGNPVEPVGAMALSTVLGVSPGKDPQVRGGTESKDVGTRAYLSWKMISPTGVESTENRSCLDKQQAAHAPPTDDQRETGPLRQVKEDQAVKDNQGSLAAWTSRCRNLSNSLLENPDAGITAPREPVMVSPAHAITSSGSSRPPEMVARLEVEYQATDVSHDCIELAQPQSRGTNSMHFPPTELRVQLRPAALGKVEVSLQMQRTKIEARVLTGTPVATAMLQEEQLSGSTVKDLSISVLGPVSEMVEQEKRRFRPARGNKLKKASS